MAFFRQTVAPFLILLVFLIALVAVSARIFLPSDMVAPAPIEEVSPDGKAAKATSGDTLANLSPSLSTLVKGLPDDQLFVY